MRVEFGLLGPLLVQVDGASVSIGSAKVATLLATLLTSPDEVVSVDRLTDCLWNEGEASPIDSRAAVQTYVRRLRSIVGAQTIQTVRGGYRAVLDEDSLDVLRFDTLVRRARTLDPHYAAQQLDAALRLWRGDPLAGIDSDVLQREEAPPLLERGLLARRRWTEAYLAIGEHDQAITELNRLTLAYPLREGLHELLMLALYRAGRRADALLEFQRFSKRLADELGIRPGAGLRRLHQSMLTDDQADAGAPDDAPVRMPTPAQLPAEAGGFVGRRRELATLDDQLLAADQTGVAVAVVAGGAGVGKTALAVHWAHLVADRFADGQLYVDLHGWSARTPVRAIDALAGFLVALGVRPAQVPPDESQAAALFRSLAAGRRLLVVLDNAEDAAQVRPLLPSGAGSLVLVTSRGRLGGLVVGNGARRLDLDVLSPEDATRLLSDALGGTGGLASLAAACAYLPLALRITVANVRSDPVRGVAGYLAELSGPDPMAALALDDDPETAIRTAFDLSYQRLPGTAQRLFSLLGSAPGPDLGLPAAVALTGSSTADTSRVLGVLASAHLVTEHRPGRYSCHSLLRAYAREQARREPTSDAALRRLLDWYLHSAGNAVHAIDPVIRRLPNQSPRPAIEPWTPADSRDARAWLDDELDNLVAVVRSALDANVPAVGWRLGYVLRGYFDLSRQLVPWTDVAHAAMAAADADGGSMARASALAGLAHLRRCSGDFAHAIELADLALPLARQADWADGEHVVLAKAAIAHQHAGDLSVAAGYHRRLLEQLPDRSQHAAAVWLGNLGTVFELMGRLTDSIDHSRQALDIYRRHGDDIGIALATVTIGTAEHQRGTFDVAGSRLETALKLSRDLSYRLVEILALLATARLHRDTGRLADAAGCADAAVVLAEDTGDQPRQVSTLNTRASIRFSTDLDAAAADLTRALAIADSARIAAARAETIILLAAVERRRGDLSAAERRIAEALRMCANVSCRGLSARAHIEAAQIRLDTGDLARSSTHAASAVRLCRELEQHVDLVQALLVLARTAAGPGAARRARREAADLADRIGLPAPDVASQRIAIR